MYWPNSTWTWSLFLVVIGQAVIGLALEGFVFGRFIQALRGGPHTPEVRSIDTFLSLFIFGFLYEVYLTWDALKNKNTIQVIGLCAYNVGLIIYAAIQVNQIEDSIITLASNGTAITADLWPILRPFLVAIPCVTALGTVLICIVAWKLYDEFSWSIYKNISADVAMRRRYLVYLIYITLLKFDFFFFISFTVQFTVVVLETRDIEFALTIAALPVIIIVLFLAAFWARKESAPGMIVVMVMYLGAMAYFLFKLVRMYDVSSPAAQARVNTYIPSRRSLTTFAVVTLLLLVATIFNAMWCTLNFGKGLKPHLERRKLQNVEDKVYPYETNVPYNGAVPLGQVTTRMTID
ncbi:hypothetical protein KVT40_002299 [Elsinoe batatas]|uniref:Uncharacterized protein n=1 Tax=Elsinoe batatas TaxID=2601811 RepID=A0A8K0L8D6_9PEZI|nr:hypothetical protein KVT40_002299 [Elsinoe batatas]